MKKLNKVKVAQELLKIANMISAGDDDDLAKKFKKGQKVQFQMSGPQDWKVIDVDADEQRLIVQLEETGYKKTIPMSIVTKINGKYMRYVQADTIKGNGWGRFSKDLTDMIKPQIITNKDKDDRIIMRIVTNNPNTIGLMNEEKMTSNDLLKMIADTKKSYVKTGAEDKFTLRIIDQDVMEKSNRNTTFLDYPVEMTGTGEELMEYAKKKHLKWKREPNYMFGGYWNDAQGNSYMPT